jgi:hypothetical protein
MALVPRIPWGSLPLELYVLSQWNSPSLTTDDLGTHRRQLAQKFTAIGYSGRFVCNVVETDAVTWELSSDVQQELEVAYMAGQFDPEQAELLPPRADWESILAPLRTELQRKLASPFSFVPNGSYCWGVIWLRTCYHEDSDEAHQRLLDRLNWDQALELEELILDDVALYDYGDDWDRIFEVVPERLLEELLDDKRLRDAPEIRKAPVREEQHKLDIEGVADLKQATVRLHYHAVRKYLFVADKTALDTGKVLVVFFDDCGRMVRQSRMEPEFGEGLAGAWANCSIDEMNEFSEAEIGPDYLPGGPCGPPYTT